MQAMSKLQGPTCPTLHSSKPSIPILCTPRSPLLQTADGSTIRSRANARANPPFSRSAPVANGLARHILAQPGIEGDPLAFLDVTEAFWRALRNQKHEPHKKGPTVVTYVDAPLPGRQPSPSDQQQLRPNGTPSATAVGSIASAVASRQPSLDSARPDFDVIICGGTLGIFLATALQLQGWRVAVVEKRLVQGRNQEWNISWGELQVLEDLGLLSHEELKSAVASEFNPIRVGFVGGKDMWITDVLNLGVNPKRLIEVLRQRFTAAGGVVYENTAFRSAAVHTNGVQLNLTPGGSAAPLAVGDTNRPNGLAPPPSTTAPASPLPSPAPRSLSCRVLLDCMGHYSDIVKQIRGRVKPDGMCMVVGACAEGFADEANTSADLLYSFSHARHDLQLFWEAFPAEGGAARTTYMFTYSDAHPERPSFEQLLDTYFELLPEYQGQALDQLRFKRVLFGGFPCYNNGPLPPAFDRVMQIGDASAAQSPLSFGGFGCMLRHLGRLSRGLDQALSEDRLTRSDLSWLQPYQPSLAASWLFQRSMSFGVGQAAYPPGYPHVPPYAATPTAAAAYGNTDGGESVGVPLVMGAAAGPGAAFQEAVAMAAARFAAGAADPADYFHEEREASSTPSASASQAAAVAVVQTAPTAGAPSSGVGAQQQRQLMERDFRTAPSWMRLPYSHVNEILGCNFGVMAVLGDRVLRPFLQDTIQFGPLSLSMLGMMLANPMTVSRVLLQVGPQTLISWFGHFTALLGYTLAYVLLRPLRNVVSYYGFQRLLDALEYGSGSDYHYHGPSESPMPTSPTAVAAAVHPKSVAVPAVGGALTVNDGVDVISAPTAPVGTTVAVASVTTDKVATAVASRLESVGSSKHAD